MPGKPTTRVRIAASAQRWGWTLTQRHPNADVWGRGSMRIFVEYTARGSIGYASVRHLGAPRMTTVRGAGKEDQINAAMRQTQEDPS